MEKKIINNTFSDLINERINRGMVKANSHIYYALNDKGYNISARSVRAYREGYRIPRFFVAKEIVNILGIDINDKDLNDILDYSKQVYKNSLSDSDTNPVSFDRNDKNEQTIMKTKTRVTVDIDKLMISSDNELKKEMIYDRIVELFGDEERLDDYIVYLIDKYLNENK